MTEIKLSYGVFLRSDTVYEILPKMLATMSLVEKKAVYAGLDYRFLDDLTKARLESVDADDPEFMVTDFGRMEIMEVFRDYVHTNYRYLHCSPFDDEQMAAVYLHDTQEWISDYGKFETEKFNNIPAEEKAEMDRFITEAEIDLKPQNIVWSEAY